MKQTMHLPLLLSLLLLSPQAAQVQEDTPPTQLTSTVQDKSLLAMSLGTGIFVLPAGSEEFYVQKYGAEDPYGSRIARRSFNGSETMVLDATALAKAGKIPSHEYYLIDYSTDPRGGLVSVVAWGEKYMQVSHSAVLDVDDDGNIRSFLDLTDGFMPSKAAAFYSGNYLLVGSYIGDPFGKLRLQIRDYRGTVVVRQLQLFTEPASYTRHKEHEQSSADQASGNEDAKPKEPFQEGPDGIPPGASMAFAMTSTDDNHIYAYSVRSPDVIEKISDTGEHKSFPIVKPPLAPDQVLRPMDMYAAHRQILLHFAAFSKGKPDPKKGIFAQKHYWSAYSTDDDSLLQTYASDAEDWMTGALLVGYEPRNFYFLEAHQLPSGEVGYSLLHATPK